MKFLFVHSWQGFSLAEWYLREALTSHCLKPVKIHSIDVSVSGIPANDLLIRTVSAWQPDVVGFSCHYWSMSYFLEAASWIKQLHREVKIVFGGPQVRSVRSADTVLMDNPHVDFVIRGPGEVAICRLFESIDNGGSLETVPGLSYRNDKRVFHNSESSDSLWKRNIIFHDANSSMIERLPLLREVSYETILGCRSRCAYCYYPTRRLELVDDDIVCSEISFFCSHEVPIMRICDPHFGGSKNRAKKILRYIRTVNRSTKIKIYVDLAHIDQEYVNLMRDAQVYPLSIGVETTNIQSLELIRRDSVYNYSEELQILLHAFPDVPADVIVGLPGDTRSGFMQTLNDVLAMGFSGINVFRLSIFPGTDIADNESIYFGSKGITCTSQGQIISSPNFSQDIQQDISNLIHAVHIICPCVRTRKLLVQQSKQINILELLCSFGPDRLMEISEWLNSNSTIFLNSHLYEIIEDVAVVCGNVPGIREALHYDLTHFIMAKSNN
jgi:radical SAM superfamily enzyme YgiQ (UPF0313 family)